MSGQKSIDGQMGLTRREVLIAASTLAASWGAVRVFNQAPPVSGALVGANSKAGHILRSQFDRSPDQFVDSGTVVVGGGIAGLSAAWWLQKQGHQNFELLELDKIVGGNSQSGENQTSRFPWGAHYVPAPGPDAKYVRLLFEELGIIEGYSSEGLPIYNEYAICGAPKERLYLHGRWQTGMVPKLGLKPKDKQQIEEFDGFIETQALRVGADGRPAFTIPVDLSSQDPEILYLDQMSMAQFLDKRGWDSQALRWYINYCCRDDFGSDLANTSAWAGIHYFASRSGNAANLKEEVVVTWPEGNGWLVRQLKAKLSENIKTDQLVFAIKNTSSGVIVDSIDTETLRVTRRLAERVIFAGPQYVAQHLISEVSKQRADDFEYSPWVVANLTVAKLPHESEAPLCWDNVSYLSDSLGYINSSHQKLQSAPSETVLTYYWPLSHKSPKEERRQLHKTDYSFWRRKILKDFYQMHPSMKGQVKSLDLWFWGHGMIVPKPGFLWSPKRERARQPIGNIHFAHSDLSGISIFEEAQYQGVRAAKECLQKVNSSKS